MILVTGKKEHSSKGIVLYNFDNKVFESAALESVVMVEFTLGVVSVELELMLPTTIEIALASF